MNIIKITFIVIVHIISFNLYAEDLVYSYKEKGFVGELKLSSIPACAVKDELGCTIMPNVLKVQINTVNKSEGHTCEFEGIEKQEARISSDKKIDATFYHEDTGYINVILSGKTAIVDSSNAIGACGLRGYMGGKYKELK